MLLYHFFIGVLLLYKQHQSSKYFGIVLFLFFPLNSAILAEDR